MNKQHLPTVLFVEDDVAILNLLRRLSAPLACTSLFAADGEAALGLCARQQIDIVISDFLMPGMTGLALLSTVARQWPQTRRVLVSGHPRTFFAEDELEDVVVVPKPWRPGELREVLDTMIADVVARAAS